MKKGISIAAGLVAVVSAGALAESKFHFFADPTDLYAKNSITNQCVRLVTSTGVISSAFEVNVGQTTIKSDGGTSYTLWDNNTCTGSTHRVSFIN